MRRFLRWGYGASADASTRRDMRLDLLRGFCVVVMVADHIGGERSWVYILTGGNRFFTSAAEGFVLISGIVMGTVYLNVIRREGMNAMLRKVLKRAGFLYLLTVSLTILFALVSYLMDSAWSQAMTPTRPLEFLLSVGTLHRSYPITDVLMLYTLLVFAAPPLLYLLGTGRTKIALAGAWGLWLLWQVSPADVQFPWNVVDGGFPFAAWQLPFAMGVIVGYHREQIARALTPRMRAAIVVVGAVISLVLIVAFQLTIADRASDQPSLLAWLLSSDLVFGKNDLRPGRLLALVGVATFAYALVTLLWAPIRRGLGWLLLPLGQRSLGAYGIHLFVLALSNSWLGDMLRIGTDNTILQVVSILVIWALLPVIPWLGEIEHLASRVAPLTHPFVQRFGTRIPVAETG
ncbi:MAG TPA: OpgC domain-containing protein [Candidatus Limnocylindria bacterium]